MARLNSNYQKLQGGYLTSQISKKLREYRANNPESKIIKLGIGDTTQPLTPSVVSALSTAVYDLSQKNTYTGYGDEHGSSKLREALSKFYSQRDVVLESDEIFISDGAKSDAANIQEIFASDSVVAVQDPVYPVYIDSSVMHGLTGDMQDGKYKKLIYLACTAENGFFPDLPDTRVDLIYFCNPNNPTGAVATRDELQRLVDYAREREAIIIYDAAYSAFIQDDSLPKSIYETEGAATCAIEISSFSKWAGFTGVRLGWTVVPKTLVVQDSKPGDSWNQWFRRQATMFNGASNIAQAGGLAVLTDAGQQEVSGLIDYYMANAKSIRAGLEKVGFTVYGGDNAPYIWAKTPNGMNSWKFFDLLLEKVQVVCTPGSIFGPSGEGYFRLSAFGNKEETNEAIDRITNNLKI